MVSSGRCALGSARATLLREIAETDPCAALTARLEAGVHEEPPAGLREGGIIRDGFHAELDELKRIADGSAAKATRLAKKEAEEDEPLPEG